MDMLRVVIESFHIDPVTGEVDLLCGILCGTGQVVEHRGGLRTCLVMPSNDPYGAPPPASRPTRAHAATAEAGPSVPSSTASARPNRSLTGPTVPGFVPGLTLRGGALPCPLPAGAMRDSFWTPEPQGETCFVGQSSSSCSSASA
jgi:hypothetical protein